MKKINTKTIAGLSILGAMSIILMLIPFLRFQPFPPLEYDVGDLPIMIASFLYGPIYGFILTVIVAVVQGTTVSAQAGLYGIFMNILSTGTFVIIAGMIYRHNRTLKGAISGLIIGVLCTVVVMIGANMIVTPIYLGLAPGVVRKMLVPTIIPFNFFKYSVNGLLCFLLYKKTRKAIAMVTRDQEYFKDDNKDNKNDITSGNSSNIDNQ